MYLFSLRVLDFSKSQFINYYQTQHRVQLNYQSRVHMCVCGYTYMYMNMLYKELNKKRRLIVHCTTLCINICTVNTVLKISSMYYRSKLGSTVARETRITSTLLQKARPCFFLGSGENCDLYLEFRISIFFLCFFNKNLIYFFVGTFNF